MSRVQSPVSAILYKPLDQMQITDKLLKNIFYNPESPGFLGNVLKLKKELPDGGNVTKKEISDWLSEQDAITLHKHHRTNGRNRYIINSIDALWELDLCNMVSFASANSGYKHILTVIDVFSKYAFVRPVKNKTAIEIFKAFKTIITDSGRKPKKIQSDLGLEFKNNLFRKYCYANNIEQNYPQIQSLHKCAVIERFNRTLKQLIFKYFSSQGQDYRRYIHVLQNIVKHYNNTIHSTIKMSPASVKPQHTVQVYNNIRKDFVNTSTDENNPLLVDDYVRIIRKKQPLEHAYTEKWKREIFQVSKVIDKKPYRLYKVKDLRGTEISGKFYHDQLQKIKINPNRPRKIIKSRGIGSSLEHYVETAGKQHIWISHKQYIDTKL